MAYITALMGVIFFGLTIILLLVSKIKLLEKLIVVLLSFAFLCFFLDKAHKSAELIDKNEAMKRNIKDIVKTIQGKAN